MAALEVLFALFIFFIVFVLGMSVLTSPILVLLYIDKSVWLRKVRYRLGFQEQIIKRSINQNHPFYKSLDEEQKKRFLWRIFYFLNTTEFVIKFNGDHNKIKTSISFVAAQVSYALTIRCFDLYNRVIVYEDDYYSNITQRYHKGEVNPGAGVMVFSWSAVQYGLSQANDGLNVLVHEFAHALRHEHVMTDYDIFDGDDFAILDRLLRTEFENLPHMEANLFRNYAKTNIEEFFAVASETFFERPVALKTQMPAFYRAFQNLYRQDPAARQSQS